MDIAGLVFIILKIDKIYIKKLENYYNVIY